MRHAIQIAERLDLNGVFVETQPTRFYPETRIYAHTLGYVRAPDEKDIARIKEQGKDAASMVGKQGLERTHEVHLMGKAGQEEVVLDNLDKPVRTVSFEPAIPGQKLVLGLQDELQRFTWNLMAGRTGCVVALEPKTGEVLAMVSKPSYDAKIFLGQLSSGTYKQLSEDPETPLINRAISTATAPGSTFKIVHHFGGNAEGDFPSEQHFYVARADCRLATGLLHALVHTGVFHFAERCSRVATPILCPWHCKSGQPHSLKPLRSWALASERAWT